MDPWVIDNVHITIRLLLAMLLGGLVGFEREHNNHAAGLRTHILVCVGSALIMLLSMYGFAQFTTLNRDPARLASSVITGIGFLGAGTILFTGKSITGLTTAASLWVVAAIGLAIGAGFYYAAAAVTLIVLINLWVLNKIEQRYLRNKSVRIVTIRAMGRHELLNEVSAKLTAYGITTKRMTLTESRAPAEAQMDIQMELQLHIIAAKSMNPMEFIVELKTIEGVFAVSVE